MKYLKVYTTISNSLYIFGLSEYNKKNQKGFSFVLLNGNRPDSPTIHTDTLPLHSLTPKDVLYKVFGSASLAMFKQSQATFITEKEAVLYLL